MPGPSNRRRASWKREEREIAALLGGERVPVSGRTRGWAPDISHKWLSIEVKSRATGYTLLADMMKQAQAAAEYALQRGEGGKLPIGVYHVTGTHFRNSLVYMTLGDFIDWFVGDDDQDAQP